MSKRIIQEFTEVPGMSKWNQIELTESNVFDYVQELNNQIRQYKTTGYFKTYFDKYEDEQLISHERIDTSEFDDIKKYLTTEVLQCEENQAMFKNMKYKQLLKSVQAYDLQFTQALIVNPIDIINVELADIDQSFSEIGNISEIYEDIRFELESRQLVELGYDNIYYQIKDTTLFTRITEGLLTDIDQKLINYLQQGLGSVLDISEFDNEQLQIYYGFRISKDKELNHKYNLIRNIVYFGNDIDQMKIMLSESGFPSSETEVLVDDGFPELTQNLIQERGIVPEDDIRINRSYDDTGYYINTIMIEDVPIVVDLQQSKVFKTIDDAMKHFTELNKRTLITNLKEFYQENSNDIMFDNYEEVFITDLISQHYGLDIAKFRDEILETNSSIFKNELQINKLVDSVYEDLKKIPIFTEAYFTPISDYEGNFELEVESANMLLTFDVKPSDSKQSLSYTIVDQFISEYEHSDIILNSLELKSQQLMNEFKQVAKNEYNMLHLIGTEISGSNGINFEEFSEYYDYYCDIESNKKDIEKYLSDVLNSFIDLYDEDDKQRNIDLIEITNRFCNKTNYNLSQFNEQLNTLARQIVNEEVKELVSPDNDNFNQALNVDIHGYTKATKNQILLAIENELYTYYSNTHLDIKQVYFIDDIENDVDFGIWDNYKFSDPELKQCMATLDYFDVDFNAQQVLNHIAMLEEDLDIPFIHERELIEIIKQGQNPKYSTNTGVEQELFDQFNYIKPETSEFTTAIQDKHIRQLNECKNAIESYERYINNKDVDQFKLSKNETFNQILGKQSIKQLTDKQIEITMEKTITECLRISSEAIYELYTNIQSFEQNLDIILEQNIERVNDTDKSSLLDKFEQVIILSTIENEESCIKFLDNINEHQYKAIKHLLDSNINNLLQSTLAYIEVEDNKFGVMEDYILHFNQINQRLEDYSNLLNNDKLKLEVLSNPYIKHNLMIDLPLSSGQKQLLNLANKSKGQIIGINDIDKLDKRNLNIAKKVIEQNNLQKDKPLLDYELEQKELSKYQLYTYNDWR